MSIISSSLGYLIKSFKLPEDPKLSKIEEAALNNIITVAKERIWLDDPLNSQEYDSDNFDEKLGLDSVENIKKSISVAEAYICKYKTPEDEE